MEPVSSILAHVEKFLNDKLKKPSKSAIYKATVDIKSFLNHSEAAIIAQKTCELVESQLRQAKTEGERLALLCLIDSLIKQLPHALYGKLFSVGIASAFVTALAATDSDVARQRMFELRRSWIGVFPDPVMRELDVAAHAVDPGWPVLGEPMMASLPSSSGHGGGVGSDVDMRLAGSGHDAQPPAGLDEQQSAILSLLGRVQPAALDAESRSQLLACVRDLQRLSAPGSAAAGLADSLAGVLVGSDAGMMTTTTPSSTGVGVSTTVSGSTSYPTGSDTPDQIPEHVDSALDQLLSGLPTSSSSVAASVASQPTSAMLLPSSSAPALSALSALSAPAVPAITSAVTAASSSASSSSTAAAAPTAARIGCDPRLLSPLKERFEASRDIMVNGELRRLTLDRVQPLLVDRGEVRVVRFRFPPNTAIFLEWEGGTGPVRLVAGEFTKVFFTRRPFIVCLGGPRHELVVHGKPFNVPFNEPKLVPIRAAFLRGVYQVRLQAVNLSTGLPVTPILDVCQPIPHHWLDWAASGAFGGVNLLHKPPLNPLRVLAAQQQQHQGGPGGRHFRGGLQSRLPPPPPPALSSTTATSAASAAAAAAKLPPGQRHAAKAAAAAAAASSTSVLRLLDSVARASAAAGSSKQGKRRRKAAKSTGAAVRRAAKRAKRTAAATGDGGDSGAEGTDSQADQDQEDDEDDDNDNDDESDAGSLDSSAEYDSDEDLPFDLTDFIEEKLERRLATVPYRLEGGFPCPQCPLRFTRGPQSIAFQRHMDEHYRRRVSMRAAAAAAAAGTAAGTTAGATSSSAATAAVVVGDGWGVGFGGAAGSVAGKAKCRGWLPHWSLIVKPADEFGAPLTGDTDAGDAGFSDTAAAAVAAVTAAAAAAAAAEDPSESAAMPSSIGGSTATAVVAARARPELNVCGVCYEPFDTRWDDDTEDWVLQDCVELPGGGIYHPVCAEDAAAAAEQRPHDGANGSSLSTGQPADAGSADVTATNSSAATSAAASSTSAAASQLLSILREAVGLQ